MPCLLSPGMLERCWDLVAAQRGLVSIVRLNWNSDYCFQWDYREGIHGVVRTPSEALALGADIALASLAVGVETRPPMRPASSSSPALRPRPRPRASPSAARSTRPWPACWPEDEFHDLVWRSCRIAAELGADFIKTFYTGPRFAEVVEATPVPIIVLGASKVDEADALKMAAGGIAAGARGVVFGRNVFESSDPQRFLERPRRGGPRWRRPGRRGARSRLVAAVVSISDFTTETRRSRRMRRSLPGDSDPG